MVSSRYEKFSGIVVPKGKKFAFRFRWSENGERKDKQRATDFVVGETKKQIEWNRAEAEKELQRLLDTLEPEEVFGGNLVLKNKTMTIQDVFERWLNAIEKKVSKSTLNSYQIATGSIVAEFLDSKKKASMCKLLDVNTHIEVEEDYEYDIRMFFDETYLSSKYAYQRQLMLEELCKLFVQLSNENRWKSTYGGVFKIKATKSKIDTCLLKLMRYETNVRERNKLINHIYFFLNRISCFDISLDADKVKEELIRVFWEKQCKERAHNTALKKFNYIKSAFKHCSRKGYIKYTPITESLLEDVENTRRSPKKKKESLYGTKDNYFSFEEAKSFLKTIEQDKYYVPLALCLLCGLRRSEVTALKWESVDMNEKTITVERTNVVIKGGTTIEDEVKTKSSGRILMVNEETMKVLNYAKVMREQNSSDFVCCNDAGRELKPDQVSRAMKRIVTKNGFREVTVHGLRHTCASMLINKGFEVTMISKYMGHSSIAITVDIYGHLFNDSQKRMVDALDEVFAE